MKNLLKVALNCKLLLKADKKNYDSWSWPEMMIFIEIYIARRNQQGNGDKVEK